MGAVVTVWAKGVTVASCNESCYDSAEATCHCICGGENHGQGQAQAEVNAAISGPEWIRRYVMAGGLNPWGCRAQILGFETNVAGLIPGD